MKGLFAGRFEGVPVLGGHRFGASRGDGRKGVHLRASWPRSRGNVASREAHAALTSFVRGWGKRNLQKGLGSQFLPIDSGISTDNQRGNTRGRIWPARRSRERGKEEVPGGNFRPCAKPSPKKGGGRSAQLHSTLRKGRAIAAVRNRYRKGEQKRIGEIIFLDISQRPGMYLQILIGGGGGGKDFD